MAFRFSRKSRDLIRALRNLDYTQVSRRGKGDHGFWQIELPCKDAESYQFGFPVDRGTIPMGTFKAILRQMGGLSEEQVCLALKKRFTAQDYREFIGSKTKEDLLALQRFQR